MNSNFRWVVLAGILASAGCNTFSELDENAPENNLTNNATNNTTNNPPNNSTNNTPNNSTNNTPNNSTNNATNNTTNNFTNNATNNTTNNSLACRPTINTLGFDNAGATWPAVVGVQCSDADMVVDDAARFDEAVQECLDVVVAVAPDGVAHFGYSGLGGAYRNSVSASLLTRAFDTVQAVSVVISGEQPYGAMLGFECPNETFLGFSAPSAGINPIGEYTCVLDENPYVGLASVGGFDAAMNEDAPAYFVFGEFPPDGQPVLVSLPVDRPTPESRLAVPLPAATSKSSLRIRGSAGRLAAIATSSGVYVWDAAGSDAERRCEGETFAPVRVLDRPNVEHFDIAHLGDDYYLLGVAGHSAVELVEYRNGLLKRATGLQGLIPTAAPFAFAEVPGGVVIASMTAADTIKVQLLRYTNMGLAQTRSDEINISGTIRALDIDAVTGVTNPCDVNVSIGVMAEGSPSNQFSFRKVMFPGVPQ